MLVHGAILPPRPVLEAVAAVVRAVPEPVAAQSAPEAAKGILGRFGRGKVEAAPPSAVAPMLEHVPVARMSLPIAGLGNLTTGDAERVAGELAAAAADWTAPEVWFAGGTALDFPGDWSVWARLEGDVDALADLARGVTRTVEALGLFVDRRVFRPMLSVATVTTATSGPFLQDVVDALDGFRGEPWTADVALTKESFVGDTAELVEFHRIQVG